MIQVNSTWPAYMVMLMLLLALPAVKAESEMKPFTLAFTSTGDIADKLGGVKSALGGKGFEIVGEYSPYPTAYILIVTNYG